MNEQRRQILQMLGEGKITADEAERLIDALERQRPESPGVESRPNPRPKYLRVVAISTDDSDGDGPSRVDVRVPLQLLRAGVRLTSLIPPQALTKVNAELSKSGVPIDLAELKPQYLEELVEQLQEVDIDIDDSESKVRVYCE